MPKIKQKREECIGCGACIAVDQENWKMDDDAKATLIDGNKNGDLVEKEISEDKRENAKQAVDVCPVDIISIDE